MQISGGINTAISTSIIHQFKRIKLAYLSIKGKRIFEKGLTINLILFDDSIWNLYLNYLTSNL